MSDNRTIYCMSSFHMPPIPSNGYDALSVYAFKTLHTVMRDRFGFLNQFSPYRLYAPATPFPSSDNTSKFSDIMDSRAAQILSMARQENKDIYIFYSGGVDSTAMTIAFLKAACGVYSDLRIVYSAHSEHENPVFTEHLRKLGVSMELSAPGRCLEETHRVALTKGYVIDGNCADQLFGSALNQDFPELYHKDYRLWLSFDDAIQQIEAASTYYGLPIKTFGEFSWFMNFACKYNFVKHFDIFNNGYVSPNKITFYDTLEFNSWSVSNFDCLHKHPQHLPENYKIALKDYIFEYNHDSSYKNDKGKVGSWGYTSLTDTIESRCYPVRITIMETPDRFVIADAGISLPDTPESNTIRACMVQEILSTYRK